MQRVFTSFDAQEGYSSDNNFSFHRSSEKLEVVGSLLGFDYLGGHQELTGQTGMSHPHTREQQESSDLQWKQHLLAKRIQEIQQQQHFQQLRPQNTFNQAHGVTEQAATNEFPFMNASNYMPGKLIGGESKLASNSHVFNAVNMNWGQRNMPLMQGIQNGLTYSQDQGQSMHLMGYVPRQLEQSLHGTPVSNGMEYLTHYMQLQGLPHDRKSVEMIQNTGETHTERTSKQLFAFDHYQNDQHTAPNDGHSSATMLSDRKGTQGETLFGNNVVQSTNNDVVSGSIQQLNHLTKRAQVQEFQNGMEQTDWLVKSHENMPANIAPSRGATSLDPIEEKILFGDDGDGNWDVFPGGRSNRLVEAYMDYPMPNNDILDVYPSHPSGTWSALMQEALEVSSSDTDQHEDWSGLGIQNTEPPAANPAFLNDIGKHDTISDGNFNLHTKPFQLFNEAKASPNCHSVPGSQQPIKISYEQSEKFHSGQQLIKETSDTVFVENHQPYNFIGSSLQERQELQQNTPNDVWEVQTQPRTMHFMESSERRLSSPEMQHSWIHQQKMRSNNINCQSNNELSGWEVELPPDSVSHIFNNCENDEMNQYARNNDATAIMHKELSHARSLGKFVESKEVISMNSPGVPEFGKSENNDLKMSGDHTYGANFADFMNPNSYKSNMMMNEPMINSHQVDPLKFDTDYLFMKGKEENLVNHQKQISIYPQDWNSSSACANKESGETCGFSHLQPSHKTNDKQNERDNSLLPGNDQLGIISIGQKPSSQSDENPLGYRRFQFHPMGNLETPSHPVNWGLNAQEKEHLANSQLGCASSNSVTMLKHNKLDTPQISGLKLGPPSQKVSGHSLTIHSSMQKVNNTGPRNIGLVAEAAHCSWPPSTTSAATLSSIHEASQRENLDNKPVVSAQTSMEVLGSDIQGKSFGMMNQVRSQSVARRQQQELQQQQHQQCISYESRQVQFDQDVDVGGHLKHAYTVQAHISHDRYLTDQTSQALFPGMPGNPAARIASFSDNGASILSEFNSEDRGHSEMLNESSNQRNTSQRNPEVEIASTSLSSIAPVVSKGDFSNLFNNGWRNATTQQLSELQPHKFAPNLFQSMNPLHPSPLEDGQIAKVGIPSSEIGFRSINSQQFSYGEETQPIDANSDQKHAIYLDVSTRVGTSQADKQDSKNISAKNSGVPIHSLVRLHQQDIRKGKSTDNQRGGVEFPTVSPSHNDVHQHNFSLLQQMQAMKRTGFDPSMVVGKSLKATECNTYASTVEFEGRDRYICELDAACKESDAASRENGEESANASHLHVGELQSHSPFSSPKHHDRISIHPQMAPSLFEQYRAYKENQTSDSIGSSRSASKAAQNYFFSKTCEPVDNKALVKRKDDIISDNSFVPLAPDHHLSPCLKVKLTDESLFLSRKKRKISSSDFLPWHKLISQSSQSLRSFSITKMDWAQANNRLIENVEDDIETVDDVSTSHSKMRLILTTQLMQQIFPPVDAKLMWSDAKTTYEKVIYYLTKLTLGEVCSLISVFENDSCSLIESESMVSRKHNTSKKMREEFFSKLTENFIAMSRKLQSNFSRLDGSSLMFDARMESQDLEQGSIINRFAKFHVRIPKEGFEGSSTSESYVRRTFPQRNVTAVPMPRNLPDRVNCLSL